MSEIDSARPRLVLDASTKTIALGVFHPGEPDWQAFAEASGDALESIFDLTRKILREAKMELSLLSGVDFCAGPGSLLGLRLAAMAVQTWQCLPEHRSWQIRQYCSLAYAAARQIKGGEREFTILSPFRRDRFNALRVNDANVSTLDLTTPSDLDQLPSPLYWVPNGAVRIPAPEGTAYLNYELSAFPLLAAANPAWLKPVDTPEVYLPEAPAFALWSADRHRKKEVE